MACVADTEQVFAYIIIIIIIIIIVVVVIVVIIIIVVVVIAAAVSGVKLPHSWQRRACSSVQWNHISERHAGAGWGEGGIRGAAAWGEKYATNQTFGYGKTRATHAKAPIAEESVDVLHVAPGKYQ